MNEEELEEIKITLKVSKPYNELGTYNYFNCESVESLIEQNTKLQQENHQLKEQYEKAKISIIENCDLRLEINQLKDKIKKAINFIGPLDRESLSLMEYETLECILAMLKGEENK